MSDALSFAEIDGQRVELLPARTVMSVFATGGTGIGGPGGKGTGGIGVPILNNLVAVGGDQTTAAGSGFGGAGGPGIG